ncbi:hypothetical protein [Rickettsia amblyommatis]|nr:hypothetical protein APHACPA_1323 [Rickettsia amblyommatis str. Ac/Pa]KJV93022.1 hypothetical protein RAMDARK_0992 [Rickettsia amblyommatis str. Darkwater]
MRKFGGLIHKYTIKDALKDNMIIPFFMKGVLFGNILKMNHCLINILI